MLTVKQAAQRKCLSPQLIYLWCHEGRLAHYRLGGRGRRGRILIDEADLDAFLTSCRVEAGGAPPAPVVSTRRRP
jgi:excisionase family DNA binding protein